MKQVAPVLLIYGGKFQSKKSYKTYKSKFCNNCLRVCMSDVKNAEHAYYQNSYSMIFKDVNTNVAQKEIQDDVSLLSQIFAVHVCIFIYLYYHRFHFYFILFYLLISYLFWEGVCSSSHRKISPGTQHLATPT
jgi:hypothetical protein